MGEIWRLAANILIKQSWKADQVWSSNLGVWREANNLTVKTRVFRNVTQGLGAAAQDGNYWRALVNAALNLWVP